MKTVHTLGELEGSANDAYLLAFSLESSVNKYSSQDDWHVSLKIADTCINFKIESEADCNVIYQSLFDRLPEENTRSRQCKAKLKVYDLIEKEMSGIVFGCDCFHDYLYGQHEISLKVTTNRWKQS